jgi:hypothetical protein
MSRLDRERSNIILSRFGMRGDVLLQRLQQLKESIFQGRERLAAQNPTLDTEQDARLKALQKLINVIERTQFQVHIIGKLLDDDWCQANLQNETQQGQDYKRMLIVELEITTKYGFGMSFFTLLESYFRVLLRALDSAACNRATDAFAANRQRIVENLPTASRIDSEPKSRQRIVEIL